MTVLTPLVGAEWLAANAAVFVAVLAPWNRLRPGAASIDLPLLIFLNILARSLLVWGAGVAGWLTPHGLAGMSVLAAGLMLTTVRRDVREGAQALGQILRTVGSGFRRHPWTGALLAVLALVLALRAAAHVLYTAPYIWDVLCYHLPKVVDWVQTGTLQMAPTPIARSYWPAGFELLQAWFVVFPHHDAFIEAAGLPYYALAVISVFAMARSLDLDRRASAFAGLLFAATPAVMLHAVNANNDLPVGALYLFAVALALHHLRHGGPWTRTLMLLAAILAFGTGVKATLVFLAPGVLVILLAAAWARRPHPWNRAAEAAAFARFGFTACLVLLAAMILGGWWYARNLALFDNPFHPASFSLGGHLIFGSGGTLEQQGSFRLSSLAANLMALIERRMFDGEVPWNPDLPNMAGWGWLAVACGVPALIPAWTGSRRFRPLAVGFAVSLAMLLASVTPDPWCLRFALWFPALTALAVALTFRTLQRPAIRASFAALAACCVLLNLAGALSNGYLSPRDWRSMARRPLAVRHTPREGALGKMLGSLAPDEVLGHAVNASYQLYALYDPDLRLRLCWVDPRPGETFADAMRRLKVRHLFVPDSNGRGLARVRREVEDGGLVAESGMLFRLP